MLKKLLLSLTVIVLVIIHANHVLAATGCRSTTSGYIYTVRSGSYNPSGPVGTVPNYRYASGSDRVLESSVFCTDNSTNDCWIGGNGSGSIATGPGTLITFTYVQCPIDDYIPLLVTLISGIGLFYIKRKTPYILA